MVNDNPMMFEGRLLEVTLDLADMAARRDEIEATRQEHRRVLASFLAPLRDDRLFMLDPGMQGSIVAQLMGAAEPDRAADEWRSLAATAAVDAFRANTAFDSLHMALPLLVAVFEAAAGGGDWVRVAQLVDALDPRFRDTVILVQAQADRDAEAAG